MPKKKRLYGKSRTIPVLKTELETLSWLRRGKVRKFVFLHITGRTMPSDIVEMLAGKDKRKSASYYSQVSRALEELETQGLVKCLNPREKTGIFYQLTKLGKEVRKQL